MMTLPRSLATVTLLLLSATAGLAEPPPPVLIDLRLDAAALADLQSRGEKVIVAGWYYGEPTPDTDVPVDEMGQIYLGAEELTLWPAAETLVVMGGNLGAAPVDAVVQPMINVNVFTARHTHQDNLLDCGLVDGPLADLAAAPQVISCKLIGG